MAADCPASLTTWFSPPVSDSRFFLLRLIRIHATVKVVCVIIWIRLHGKVGELGTLGSDFKGAGWKFLEQSCGSLLKPEE